MNLRIPPSVDNPADAIPAHAARRRRRLFLGVAGGVVLVGGVVAWSAGVAVPGLRNLRRVPWDLRGSDAGVNGGAPTRATPVAAHTGSAPKSVPPATPAVATDARARNTALHAPRPAIVRGLYLNAWAAGSPRKLAKLIAVADHTEVNTFVIDVKEGGFISYPSNVPLARQIGSDSAYIRDIRGVLAQLKTHGIYPIARIVCFKDATLAEKKPEWAIRKADGSLWRADDGKLWVDAYNKNVWDYNIAIAQEALELGFGEVQWDYVRFPDVLPDLRATQVFPDARGRTREAAIREFLEYARQQLAPYGTPMTADVFGSTVKADDDMGIGQKWERFVDAADVVLPMVYPSHFYPGDYDMRRPNYQPYRTVFLAMQGALARSKGVTHAATIRPWLQDFTMGPPHYGSEHVRAQMRAVYDAGLREWILWNPGSNYNVLALRPKGQPDPDTVGAAPGVHGDTANAEVRRTAPRPKSPATAHRPVRRSRRRHQVRSRVLARRSAPADTTTPAPASAPDTANPQ